MQWMTIPYLNTEGDLAPVRGLPIPICVPNHEHVLAAVLVGEPEQHVGDPVQLDRAFLGTAILLPTLLVPSLAEAGMAGAECTQSVSEGRWRWRARAREKELHVHFSESADVARRGLGACVSVQREWGRVATDSIKPSRPYS